MLGAALGLHFGSFVSSAAAKAAKAYSVRVLADGGSIEAYQCMVDKLTYLTTQPTFVVSWDTTYELWNASTKIWNL